MMRALYTAASGMRAQQTNVDTQAGQGAGAFLLLATRRPGATPVASQRRCPARPPGTVPARRTEGVRLPAGHHAPHRQ